MLQVHENYIVYEPNNFRTFQAEMKGDFHLLLHAMSVSSDYDWMRLRIGRMSSKWISGGHRLKEKYPEATRVKKKVSLMLPLDL